MIPKWRWLAQQFTRRLWFRATLFCVFAIFTALLAVVVEPLIPGDLSESIGAGSVDHILNILATSMLAVTTFSLTVMVSAYSAASNSVTPRATRLLQEDSTTQNVLSTFLGSFLFALVGIIALQAGVYGDSGRVLLFLATVLIVVVIVLTMLRWIEHLSQLGRVGATTDRVEEAALCALLNRAHNPYLGGQPWLKGEGELPDGAVAIYVESVGYVQHVDMEALSNCAESEGGAVYMEALPGAFVYPARPLVWVQGESLAKRGDTICAAFTIARERSFDQDPRFGLSVLEEIASRALSPAVNDLGTALDVVGRGVRLLYQWHQAQAECDPSEPLYPRIFVPPISLDDLFDDLFLPIGRDGAGMLEVQQRLQKGFLALAKTGDPRLQRAALRHSQMALQRSRQALHLEEDNNILAELAAAVARCCGTESGRTQYSSFPRPVA